jgi:hypothetical protein
LLCFTAPKTNNPNTRPPIYPEYATIHKLPVKNPPKTSQHEPVYSQTQTVYSQRNDPEIQSTTQNSEEQNLMHFTVPSFATVPTIPHSLKAPEGNMPLSHTNQASAPVHPRNPLHVNIYQIIPLVALIPAPSYSKAIFRPDPTLPAPAGPQHTPQIPIVNQNVSIVTPAHTNAPQVPLASQNTQQVPLVPEYTNEKSPYVPFVLQNNREVSYIPEVRNVNDLQEPHVSHSTAQFSIIPEKAYLYVPHIPLFSQNIKTVSVPENFPTNSPQIPVPFTSQNRPQFPFVVENANKISAQVPFVSESASQAPSVPVKTQTPVNNAPQNDSHLMLVLVNLQKKVLEEESASQNVPTVPIAPKTSVNLQKLSKDFPESSEKPHNPSHCSTIIKEASQNNYPILIFKNVLNPFINIQEYYEKTSTEPNKNRLFRCHWEDERSFVSSPHWLSYHCHSDDIPVKLLVEVPRVLRQDSIIDVELYTPYFALVNDAWNGKYEGVEKKTFLEDLLTPCTYGMAVLKSEGASTRLIPMPIAVSDGKFIVPITECNKQVASVLSSMMFNFQNQEIN